jgi:hypothetical protein
MEKTMLKGLVIVSILAIGSLATVSAQAAHSKRIHRHATFQSGDITNFSSSSAPTGLNVGINHPPKK